MTDAAAPGATRPPPDPAGPVRFARFAYPPNALGYCGPDAAGELLERADAGPAGVDPDLRRLAEGFEGAWPWLELIAHGNGIADPLDARVVEAYWLGNDLLDRVRATALGPSLADRFRDRLGADWRWLAEVPDHQPRPHHGLHVFAVSPWVGMLRGDGARPALEVLDRCRIRWGRVLAVDGATAVVTSAPLRWDGRTLTLGPARPETVQVAHDGRRLTALAPGDDVACHWDWACERLGPRTLAALRRETAHQLDLVNRRLAVSPVAAALG